MMTGCRSWGLRIKRESLWIRRGEGRGPLISQDLGGLMVEELITNYRAISRLVILIRSEVDSIKRGKKVVNLLETEMGKYEYI